MHLDALDILIVDLLRADPQTSNKSIAFRVGVSEPTVAARIRSLTERRLIRVTAQRDIHAMGFNLIAHLDIYVEGRPVPEVSREICEIPEVSSVVVLMGSPQIIAQVHAQDGAALLETMDNRISPIAGIERIESIISLAILKYRLDIAELEKAE